MRASLGALFRPSQVAKLRTAIRRIADSLLDDLDDPDEYDLMQLCWEVPARTYCELVSIPYSESGTVIRIADSVLGTLLNVDTRRRNEAEAAILESVEIVRTHLNARRSNLGDDFTSVMIRQQQDGLMTEEQLVAQSFALLQASVDNTAHQMGNTFGSLLTTPSRWHDFVADRALGIPVINEIIRLYPRFGTIFRLAAKDMELGGLEIPAGAWAFVSARSGQRDPEFFDAPDEYRIDRPAMRPLMFGAGPYNCLGQNLARMEIEETLNAVADHFPGLELIGEWQRRQANAVSETSELVVRPGRRVSPGSVTTDPKAQTESVWPEAIEGLGQEEEAISCMVKEMRLESDDVISVVIQRANHELLPTWKPGAHIDVVLPGDRVRQYSLCGPQADDGTYRIAVLREEAGSGGSEYIHENLRVGDSVTIRQPRNNFDLASAVEYRFVAGGIGVTALLSMVHAAERTETPWSLVYLGKVRERMAFLNELTALAPDKVQVIESSRVGRPSINEVTGPYREGTQLYACGPSGLLQAIKRSAWPEESMHFEQFEPDYVAMNAPAQEFRLRLKSDGRALTVPADSSALDALEEAGVVWPFSCREGTCGTCEAHVIAGRVDHRDAILTPAERRASETMMVCVSRAEAGEVTLDI